MPQSQVLIVGAGPSGLILALTLLRNGVSVRIIDKNETIPPGQRGAGISPRTLELYKILGILSEIEQRGSSVAINVKFYQSPEGHAPIKEGPFIEWVEDQPEYYRVNTMLLGQDEHMKTIADIMNREYGISVEYGTELTSFENHDDHVVAHINKGDRAEATIFPWIVGAEGARSVVRKQAGLAFIGDTYAGTTLVIGDIEVTKGLEEQPVVKTWGSYGDRMLCLRPYRKAGKDYYWFALGGTSLDSEKAASGRDALLEIFYDIIGKQYLEFGELRNLAPWRANVRMVDSFSKGRAFVVGDAAHVHSPTGAQGLTSGVQDSINLGWKLALVVRGFAPQDLVNSFSSERLPIIATMLDKTTQLMTSAFQKSSENKMWGWMRNWELKQFGINYRGSALLVDERFTDPNEPVDPYRSGHDGSAHSGDRAPGAPGLITSGEGNTWNLYDILDIRSHTIFVFCQSKSPLVDEVQETLSGYEGEMVKVVVILPQGTDFSEVSSVPSFIDAEGYAYKHYKVSQYEGLVVVVRPDGYIGAVVKGAIGLKRYFSKLFL
ncbi:hypothetical protein PQX77_017505 [Marasmius sp. AFHP31]|nr:hypothetical protein PQX77_017505 [Marasmius sp. AFHP31]